MKKNILYAEILYLGFVYEKNRAYVNFYKLGCRRFFLLENFMWKNILNRMKNGSFVNEDEIFLSLFLEECRKNKEMKKCYNIAYEKIYRFKSEKFFRLEQEVTNGDNDNLIISLMSELVDEMLLIFNSNRFFIHENKIHELTRVLHNLPRYFLEERTEKFQDSMEYAGLSFENAIKYSFFNMSDESKNKYCKYNI